MPMVIFLNNRRRCIGIADASVDPYLLWDPEFQLYVATMLIIHPVIQSHLF